MQVKQRLKINAAVSVFAAVAVCLIFLISLYNVRRAVEASDITDELVESSFERNALRGDYLRTNSERARIQWFAKHEQIGQLLKAASENFSAAEEKKIIDELIRDHNSTKKIFAAIVENRERGGLASDSGGLSQDVEDRLITQLKMRIYKKILLIGELHEAARGRFSSALMLAGWGVFSILAIIIAAGLMNSWTLSRTIANRILRLREGASVIGGGNLDYRIEIEGDDEFAELAGTFNSMSSKLSDSYHDLKKEIEERTHAEGALRESEERFRVAQELLPDGFSILRPVYDTDRRVADFTWVYANPTLERIVGMPLSKLEGRRLLELFPGHRGSPFFEAYRQVTETGQTHVEEAMYQGDGILAERWFRVAIVAMKQEIAVLSQDITERKQAEDALRLTQASIDAAAEMVAWFTPDGRVRYANDAACRALGYSRDELLTKTALDFSPGFTWEQYRQHWQEVRERKSFTLEVTHRRKDGSEYPAEVLVNHVVYGGQEYIFAYGRDITERKRAEAVVRESEEKYRNLFENMAEEVHYWQVVRGEAGRIVTWRLVDANPPTLKSWGRSTAEEIRGKTTDEIFGPGAAEHYMPIVQKIMTEGVPYSFEDYFPNLDKYFRFTSVPLGEYFITTGADITAIKKAEQSLQRSEARWNAAIESFASGAIIATEDEQVIYWNPAAREMHGFSRPDEGIGPLEKTPITFQLWTLDGSHMLELDEWPMRRIKRGGALHNLELRVRRPDQGWEKVFSYSGVMVETASGERLIFLSCYDLTELRKAEEALRKSEKSLIGVLESMPDAFVSFDADMHYTYVNANAERLQGASRDELLGRDARLVYPDLESYKTISRYERVIREQKPLTQTSYHAGFGRWVEIRAFPTPDGVSVFYKDVSAQVKAERALRESEERLSSLYQSMTEGVVSHEIVYADGKAVDYVITDVNPAFEQITGMTQEAAVGRKASELYGTGSPPYLDVYAAVAEGGPPVAFETYFRPMKKHFAISVFSPQKGMFATVFSDITERKKAEEVLRQREEEFRALVEKAPDVISLFDRDLRRIYVNSQIGENTGQDASFMTGKSLVEAGYPDSFAQPLNAALESVFAAGREETVELAYEAPKGRIWLQIRCAPLWGADGLVERTITIGRDITDRKKMEEALRTSLAEKEVLLKEIHHRVKNNMQVISSLVSLQAGELQDPAMRDILEEVTHRVRSMALVHEKLYQSADLSQIDFAGYAKSLLGYLWRAYGTAASDIRLATDMEPVSLTVNTAVPCGLILNELVSNALKHAFRDRNRGEVIVSLRGSEGGVRLSVRDDGTGLPAGFDWRQSRSLGLRLVLMLAGQLGAEVEVNSNGGTEFKITFRQTTPAHSLTKEGSYGGGDVA